MSQPTDHERARWLRDGWGRAYAKAAALDRMTTRLEIREWRAVVRLVARKREAVMRVEEQRQGSKRNTSREATACQE